MSDNLSIFMLEKNNICYYLYLCDENFNGLDRSTNNCENMEATKFVNKN